jgi:glutamate/tyrosine decarboxylase-like PLP-dependent enzyme/quercetin dioxygenase-like cupin family protein
MGEGKISVKTNERTILFQTPAFEVVSIEWTDKERSALHNHGWSQCFVLIENGLFENRLDLGAKVEIQILEKGQVVATPVGTKHELHCKTPTGKTLHVYTPKIKEFDDSGIFSAPSIENLKSDIALSEPTRFDLLTSLISTLQDQSISTHSTYFMNQLFSGVLPQMLLAEDFIAKTRTTLATFEASPVLSTIEAEVVGALCHQVGWPEANGSGVSVPGGSAANFMALHCARQKAFPESKQMGLRGACLKVFVSEEAHYSFKKACAVLGLGINNLVTVPIDDRGRMKAQALDQLITKSGEDGAVPILVVATAGTTVLGAFDEISSISSVCKKHDVWLHIDGAWGGPALFSNQLRHLVEGVEVADSVTFDAHKLFGASLTSSFFLTRHRAILQEANDVAGGDYLFHSDDPALDRGKLSWQCGRKADAFSFWAIWKSLGTKGLGEFVDRLVGIREETLEWIKTQKRLELVSEPDNLNICVRVMPSTLEKNPDWSRHVREKMKDQNQALVNFSTDKDGSFLRLILVHPFLKFDHVRQILLWALAVE